MCLLRIALLILNSIDSIPRSHKVCPCTMSGPSPASCTDHNCCCCWIPKTNMPQCCSMLKQDERVCVSVIYQESPQCALTHGQF